MVRYGGSCRARPAVLLAAIVAGLRGLPLPFTGDPAPLGLGIAGSDDLAAVVGALTGALAGEPVLLFEAAIVGGAAAALPLVRRFGLWGAAGFGVAYTALAVLGPPLAGMGEVASFPILLSTWAIVGILSIPVLRATRASLVTPVQ